MLRLTESYVKLVSWTTAFLSSKITSSSGSANSSSSSDPSSSSSSLSSPSSSSSPTTRFLFKVDEEDPLGLLTFLFLGFSSTPSEDDCEDDEKITSDLELDAILGSSSVNTECKIEESSTTLVDNKG